MTAPASKFRTTVVAAVLATSKRRTAVVAAVLATAALLAAAACGGDKSSGLATLADTTTTVAAVNAEPIEPVSEPTGSIQPDPSDPAATETLEAVVSAEADTGDGGPVGADPADEVAAAAAGNAVNGASGTESEDTANGAAAEPEDTANGTGGAEPEGTTENMTDEERLLEFGECMRANGVEFPDPVVEADGTVTFGFRPGAGDDGAQRLREIGRDPDLPAARAACEGLLEGLAFGPGQGGFDLTELQDTLLEFAQCMRDNGVDVGDPDLRRLLPGSGDDPQPGGPFGGAIDLDDPDTQAAFELCQEAVLSGLAPRFGGGG